MTAAKLRELEAKATDGPWELGVYDDMGGYDSMTGGITVGPITLDGKDYGQKSCEEIYIDSYVNLTADAELIAYLRNHAQDFIKLMEAAEKGFVALDYTMGKQSEFFHNEMMQGKDPHSVIKSWEGLREALAAFKEKA